MGFPLSKVEEAKKLIRKFTRDFPSLSKEDDVKDRVYALNLQFFQLSESLNNNEENEID